MFDNIEELPSREDRGIPESYPTDPQAEILVFDKIGLEYIVAAHFANEDILSMYKAKLNGIEAKVTPRLFENREDHDWL
jgi:hypothetical protein